MRKFVDDLVAHGMAYPNPTFRWACTALPVLKPGAQFRFKVKLQPVNVFTVRHQIPIPDLKQELSDLTGVVYFTNFDVSHGYYQLHLALLSH